MKICLCLGLLFASPAAFPQRDTIAKPVSMEELFRQKAAEAVGKPFPEFQANFNGYTLSKDQLKGKVLFINFWFEACPPCIAELPALNKMYGQLLQDKNVEFLSFTYESPERIKLLKQKYHIRYKVASVSNQECYRLNQDNGFPTSIIVGKDGNIKKLFTGDNTNSVDADQFFLRTVYKDIQHELRQ